MTAELTKQNNDNAIALPLPSKNYFTHIENDLGEHPVGLARLGIDPAITGVVGLIGTFIGFSFGGPLLGAAILLASINDVSYANKQERKASGKTPERLSRDELRYAAPVEVVSAAPAVPATLAIPHTIDAIARPAIAPKNLSKLLSKSLKSTLLLGAPRSGKGYATAKAIELLPKSVDVWAIDPKNDPGESHYWSRIKPSQIVRFDVTEIEAEDAIALVDGLFSRWIQSPSSAASPKLLIIDEAAPGLSTCDAKWFTELMLKCARLASVGPSKGKFVWILSQSSTVKDLGISNGNKGGYRVCAVGHRDTAPAWYSSIASSLNLGKPSDELLASSAYIQNDGGGWGSAAPFELAAQPVANVPDEVVPVQSVPVVAAPSAQPIAAPAPASRWDKFRAQSADYPHLIALANWLERREGKSFDLRSLKKDKTTAAAFKLAEADLTAGLNTFARYGFITKSGDGEYQIVTLP